MIASIIRSAGDELVDRRRRARASRRGRRRPSPRASSRLRRIAASAALDRARDTGRAARRGGPTRRPPARCRRPSGRRRRRVRARTSRRGSLPFARWRSDAQQPTTREAIARDPGARLAGRRTGTSSRPRSSTAAASIQAERWRDAPRTPAAGLVDVRRRARRRRRRLRLGRPEPRRARDRRAVRDLRRPGRVVDRRRPRADRAGGGAARAATTREATLWVLEDNPRARAFYERAGWRRTARARRRSAGACARRRCATARSSRARGRSRS